MPRTVKDGDITREISTDYHPSPTLPGATVIPSHRGKYGAQMGDEDREQLRIVDVNLDGTPMQSPETQAVAIENNDKEDTVPKRTPQKKTSSGPIPIPDFEALRLEVARIARMVSGPTPAPAAVDRDYSAQKQQGNAPAFRVTMTQPDGSVYSCSYHNVVKHGSWLSLIYDVTHPGDRLYPAVGDGRPMTVSVVCAKGNFECSAVYMGVICVVDGKEFQLLSIKLEDSAAQ